MPPVKARHSILCRGIAKWDFGTPCKKV